MNNLHARFERFSWRMRTKYLAKFIFVHINKTGGVSVETALGLPLKNHTTAAEYRDLMGESRWDRVFSFSVVRNPWDRVVSHYHHRIRTRQTGLREHPIEFAEWVRRTYGEQDPLLFDNPKFFAPQYRWISDEQGELIVDHVCRLETIDEDFAHVCERIGIQRSLPHLNRTERGRYQDYYDDQTHEIVRAWFERDIELFEYRF